MTKPFKATRTHAARPTWAVLLAAILLLTVAVAALQAQDGTPTPLAPPPADDAPAADLTDAEISAQHEVVVRSRTETPLSITETKVIPAAEDTFITSGMPNRNWNSNPNLRLGYNVTAGLGAERIYLYFDVADNIPRNANINSARIEAYENAYAPAGDPPMGAIGRHLNSNWDAGQITWNNHLPAWGSVFGETEIPADIGWVTADVTKLVEDWVYGNRPNNGIVIIGDERMQERERIFYSLNGSNTLFPRLVVDYTVSTDREPPNVTVEPLPPFSPSNFTVSWRGDDPGGSGIEYYDVQYRVQGGSWTDWLMRTDETSAVFRGGDDGITYEFRARGVDQAGNVQAWPADAQASTTVDTQPPSVSVTPLPQFTLSSAFTVSWEGTDEGSGIASYDVQYNVNGGPWQPWLANTEMTSAQFTGADTGKTYGFRARGVDRVGNTQAFPELPQAQTTVSASDPTARIVPFEETVVQQPTVLVQWTGEAAPGTSIVYFDVRYRFEGGPWILWLEQTKSTQSVFELDSGDGVYEFQVRAVDSAGRIGEYRSTPGNSVIRDLEPPFIEPQMYLPVIFG